MSLHRLLSLVTIEKTNHVVWRSVKIIRTDVEVNRYYPCCPFGILLGHMPLEIREEILDFMSIADLVAYGGSCKVNYNLAHATIKKRISNLLQAFNLPYQGFYSMLGDHLAVVSGSCGLHVFQPGQQWEPQDMDIYVPRHRAGRLVNRLRAMHYVPVLSKRRRVGYDDLNAVHSVITLTNGDRSIDVVESVSWVPIHPIFMFHSSIIMNYISHDGFFSAYPGLTTRMLGLKHGMAFADGAADQRTQACFEKYERRGYHLQPSTFDEDVEEGIQHICGETRHCPLTVWSTFDRGCLFAPFESSVDKITNQPKAVPRCFEGRRAVVWYLGGVTCEDNYEPLHPFVTLEGAGSATALNSANLVVHSA